MFFLGLKFYAVAGVYDNHRSSLQGFNYPWGPRFHVLAGIDKYVRAVDVGNVTRGGLKGVRFDARGQEQRYLHFIPGNSPYKVILGEQSCDYRRPSGTG